MEMLVYVSQPSILVSLHGLLIKVCPLKQKKHFQMDFFALELKPFYMFIEQHSTEEISKKLSFDLNQFVSNASFSIL